MSTIDWLIMIGTTLLIVSYGVWKSRGSKDIKGYLLSNKDMKWWTIGISVMATQASAITFLSTPGQGFNDGMRFVQFYFGLPIAMVIICVVAIPIYHRLNVFTAYEYLESRFDLKTRTLGATLFLLSRSLAAGMTIYAPAIIMATLLDWNIYWTCIAIGIVVIIYTVSGGTKAVSVTQKQQMAMILFGMVVAGVIMVLKLPPEVSFGDAVHIAGKMGKLNVITTEFDLTDRYNIWSGLIAGTFLYLSYFGTDQSQVQRYLGGKSISEMRIGLLFNAIFKVPMQFLILFLGVMMFVFFQFQQPPLFFNENETQSVLANPEYADQYQGLQASWDSIYDAKQDRLIALADDNNDITSSHADFVEINALQSQYDTVRKEAKALLKANNEFYDDNDSDQVFLTFVLNHLPTGMVGLLIAVILAAAMSSTSAELNALATTTVVDIIRRVFIKEGSDQRFLNISRLTTLAWGVLAIGVSLFANQVGNLIQAVNILGSLFYGTILGLFVVAFFFKSVKGTAVFWAGVIVEALTIGAYVMTKLKPEWDFGFLWYNLIGCVLVVILSLIFQEIEKE
ncbi:MAG: sodium:solute symporter [Bacteroidota bacterium]